MDLETAFGLIFATGFILVALVRSC